MMLLASLFLEKNRPIFSEKPRHNKLNLYALTAYFGKWEAAGGKKLVWVLLVEKSSETASDLDTGYWKAEHGKPVLRFITYAALLLFFWPRF